MRRFSAWLVEEDEFDADPLVGIKPPKLDTAVVEPLTDDDLRALLKVCAGKDLRSLRDAAVLRPMIETGLRATEAATLLLEDVDLDAGTATVRRGKGGKGRVVPFGPQTVQAIDRYVRVRRSHRLASTSPRLWLGSNGQEFGYAALHWSLGKRAAAAGVEGFHPHRLRHTAAHRWLAAGGSEGGLMAVAGWSTRDMMDRYSRHYASSRAADEARGLNLGDPVIDNPRAYEMEQAKRTADAMRLRLKEIPGLEQVASAGRAPVVRLLCPPCHGSLGPPIRLDAGVKDRLMLKFLPGEASSHGTVTSTARPGARTDALAAWAAPDCPRMTRTAYCSAAAPLSGWPGHPRGCVPWPFCCNCW